MSKLFRKASVALAGLAMAVGVGFAIESAGKSVLPVEAASVTAATYTFEANTAHRTSGSNSYTGTNSYKENSPNETKDINLEYADSVTTGSPINGSANVVARVAKNTTNSPSIVLGPLDLSSYTVNGFSYYAKGSDELTITASYSTDGTNWTQAETHVSTTTSKKYSSSSLSIANPSDFYLKIVITKTDGEAPGGNRDVQIDDVVITGEPDAVTPLSSISCASQNIDVVQTANLASQIVFTPNDATDKTVSYSLKSGADYIDLNTTTGVVTGKKGGQATVTITPTDTHANPIDVIITVSSIPASGLTIGDQYVLYAVDAGNSYSGELSGIDSSLGTVASFDGAIPSCDYPLTVREGYYENSVAFENDSKYLSLNSAENKLHTKNTIDSNSSWVVTWDSETNAATIKNGIFIDRLIKFNYNGGNPRFACYTTAQTSVSLYHYVQKPLTDFSISSEVNVYVSGQADINVTYTPADAYDKAGIVWTSNNESIATVSDGTVTGVAVGDTTITATKTINEVVVNHTCTVHVLNNVAAHEGNNLDPFSVEDAVNVAAGIFTKVKSGAAVDLENTDYYIKGLLTKYESRTQTKLTFWMGDNAEQISAQTGGFEIYQAGKVYGDALSTKYASDSMVQAHFPVGATIIAKGKIVLFNGTPEISAGNADVIYNSYIEAFDFAEGFNNALSTICNTTKNNPSGEAPSDIKTAWINQASAYDALEDAEQQHLINAVGYNSGIDQVRVFAAKYDYIIGKYTGLDHFVVGRAAGVNQATHAPASSAADNGSVVMTVVIMSMVASLALGFTVIAAKKRHSR